MDALRLSLFGVMRVSLGGDPIEDKMSRVVKSLLAYLVLFRRVHAREVLLSLFWGNYSQDRARKCLNTAVWRLRKVLEPEGIVRGTYLITTPAGKIGFNWRSNCWLDVTDFEIKARQAIDKSYQMLTTEKARVLEAALKLHSGDLLEGFYDDWVLRERERLNSLHLKILVHLLNHHRHKQDYEEALACGYKILDREPFREEIHREMMRLHVANGQRALAVRQYKTCCRILDEELSVPPMEETRMVHAQICPKDQQDPNPSNLQINLHTARQALSQAQKALREFDKVAAQLRHATKRLEQFIS